jgi:starch phosphorylase
LEKIKKALFDAIDGGAGEVKVGSSSSTGKGVVVRRSGGLRGGETRVGVENMFGLMDRFLKSDPSSLQKDILDHVEYTVARSRFSFDDFEAYQVIN